MNLKECSKKFLFPFIFVTLLMAVCLCVGCGSNDGDSSGQTSPESITISGVAQKGPFEKGSIVEIFELDDTLKKTGISYQTEVIDDEGNYEITVDLKTPFVEIHVTGKYYDEITGENTDTIVALEVVASVADNTVVNINTMTTIVKPRIMALVEGGVPFNEAVSQAGKELIETLKEDLDKEMKIGDCDIDFDDLDLLKPGEENEILLMISSIILKIAENHEEDIMALIQELPTDVQEIISAIKEDLTDDGKLSEELIAEIKEAIDGLNLAEIKENLEENHPEVTLPSFEECISGKIEFDWEEHFEKISATTVEVEIYDGSGEVVYTGGPWSFQDMQSAIDEIGSGTYDKISVFFKDAEGELITRIDLENITVNVGEITFIDPLKDFDMSKIVLDWKNIDFDELDVSEIEAKICDSLGNLVEMIESIDVDDDMQSIIEGIDKDLIDKIVLFFKNAFGEEKCRLDLVDVDFEEDQDPDSQTAIVDPEWLKNFTEQKLDGDYELTTEGSMFSMNYMMNVNAAGEVEIILGRKFNGEPYTVKGKTEIDGSFIVTEDGIEIVGKIEPTGEVNGTIKKEGFLISIDEDFTGMRIDQAA